MNRKMTYEDPDIVLNAYGQVDVDFYYQKARELQTVAMKELWSAVKESTSHRLHKFYEKYLCMNCSSAH